MNNSPLILGHRGAKSEAPENTLASFRRAMELGADGVELDVMLTNDMVPVVTHNNDLSILTGHKGNVCDSPFELVSSLDAGSHFGKEFAGEKIPTLVQTLQVLREHDKLTIIEIKSQRGLEKAVVKIVGEAVSSISMRGPVILSSFNLPILMELKSLKPKLARSLIFYHRAFSFFIAPFFARLNGVSAICPFHDVITKRMMARAQAQGQKVYAWTVDEPKDLERCAGLGVDGIITNDIKKARKFFNNQPVL